MISWARRFKHKLREVDIVNEILKIYVDDINGTFQPTEKGMKLVNGRLQWNERKAKEDENKPDDERTMELVKEIANSVEEMIQLTADYPGKYEDKKGSNVGS